ncbi:glycosyl hydrolase 53 family protein [Yinghuangia seranimata]|uniref:glycosyl hydrolase 53 family protein n=1 Tax=Yinghuangia seranimata TaxID=408067 RepID=UPI00248CD19A|nr:glycosyl hydrolase 53 family protein [Yinghuangia seranimata]MDI2129391.1 glycosyl hydrolase 53 family protein [Yinghuangia seranimata]
MTNHRADQSVTRSAAEAVGSASRSHRVRDAEFRVGLSVSPHATGMFDRRVVFHDGDRTARTAHELMELFAARGGNEVWTRMGTSRVLRYASPGGGIADGLLYARLARDLGLPFNPELTLCGVYGDMGLQPEPDLSHYPQIRLRAPWLELTLEEMADALRQYGRLAAEEILGTGCRVNVWDIGNEVEFGVAGVAMPPTVPEMVPGWTYRAPDSIDPEIGRMDFNRLFTLPHDDQIAWCSTHLWPYTAALLAAVADGIRSVDPGAQVATHTSSVAAFHPQLLLGFHTAMEAGGFDAAHLGVSFFPTSTDRVPHAFDVFKHGATLTSRHLNKPVYVAEWAYPAAPASHQGQAWDHPVEGYPVSPEGQAAFLRDLTDWGAGTGILSGIRPYGPDFAGEGNWGGMALFRLEDTTHAHARPALASFREGLERAGAPGTAPGIN